MRADGGVIAWTKPVDLGKEPVTQLRRPFSLEEGLGLRACVRITRPGNVALFCALMNWPPPNLLGVLGFGALLVGDMRSGASRSSSPAMPTKVKRA
jgi:hypothetical protein